MNGVGFSPRETTDYILPREGGITQIFKHNEREVNCRPENAENRDSQDTVARIRKSPSIRFELKLALDLTFF